MTGGLLMLAVTGLGWTFTGALLSFTARHKIRGVTLLAPQMLLSLMLALVVLPDYPVLREAGLARVAPLAALLIVAGILNAVGILVLQTAMCRGHNGMVWAIGQSALVVPFLVGTIGFGEPFTLGRIIGVVGILASLLTFGVAKDGKADASRDAGKGGRMGFLLALIAFFILGVSQSVMTLPSHRPDLVDVARVRVPILYMGHCLVYGLWFYRRREPVTRRVFSYAILGAMVAVLSTAFLFAGIDRLAGVRMAALGFPVAVCCCILGFSVYSAVGLREPFTLRHGVGLTAGLSGIAGIVLGSMTGWL